MMKHEKLMKKIDAHVHLWKEETGLAQSRPNGKCLLMGEEQQMMPPYFLTGENGADMLLSNMDYAGVLGAVVTQEYLDGNQDAFLLEQKAKYNDRLKICALYEEGQLPDIKGFDGVKIPACRLKEQDLTKHHKVFELLEQHHLFLSIDLSDGEVQVPSLREMLQTHPTLRVAIGHFGMVTRKNWQEQIKLARFQNCFIESGGLTWLFHQEFYPYPSAIDAIKEARDICSMEKLMWGSDYPRTMVAITYKMATDFIAQSSLLEQEKELFFYQNAKNFYQFKDMEALPYLHNMLE